MNADSVSPAGLNHSKLNGIPVADDPDYAIATTEKVRSTTIWKPTRMN